MSRTEQQRVQDALDNIGQAESAGRQLGFDTEDQTIKVVDTSDPDGKKQ